MIDDACQYNFFGGSERRMCFRNRATAAAFLRLRSVVGFSYAVRARNSWINTAFWIERRKRRSATSTGSLGFGMTVVRSFLDVN